MKRSSRVPLASLLLGFVAYRISEDIIVDRWAPLLVGIATTIAVALLAIDRPEA